MKIELIETEFQPTSTAWRSTMHTTSIGRQIKQAVSLQLIIAWNLLRNVFPAKQITIMSPAPFTVTSPKDEVGWTRPSLCLQYVHRQQNGDGLIDSKTDLRKAETLRSWGQRASMTWKIRTRMDVFSWWLLGKFLSLFVSESITNNASRQSNTYWFQWLEDMARFLCRSLISSSLARIRLQEISRCVFAHCDIDGNKWVTIFRKWMIMAAYICHICFAKT